MRSTVKVLSAIAALAMAAGLSACDEQGASQTSAGDATASDSADKGLFVFEGVVGGAYRLV